MHILIVSPEVSDARAICHVQNEGWLSAYVNESLGITREVILSRDMESDTRVAKREQQIRECGTDMQSWIAKDGNKIVGWCVATKQEKLMLDALYILPEYHGLRIGHQLILLALSWLGNKQDIILHVTSYNLRAIRFYEKYGFVLGQDVSYEKPTFPNGIHMPSKEMVRTAFR